MSVGLDMWRFSDDINTARRFNAVAARMQPHCPVLYSGKWLMINTNRSLIEIPTAEVTVERIPYTSNRSFGNNPNTSPLLNELQPVRDFW